MAGAVHEPTSLASSSTSLSTHSGYTKSSNITPILSRSKDKPEPRGSLNLNLHLDQSSRALRTRGCYALLPSIAHGSMITVDNALETDDEGMGGGPYTVKLITRRHADSVSDGSYHR